MTRYTGLRFAILISIAALACPVSGKTSTTFTCQGSLKENGQAAGGAFKIIDACGGTVTIGQ